MNINCFGGPRWRRTLAVGQAWIGAIAISAGLWACGGSTTARSSAPSSGPSNSSAATSIAASTSLPNSLPSTTSTRTTEPAQLSSSSSTERQTLIGDVSVEADDEIPGAFAESGGTAADGAPCQVARTTFEFAGESVDFAALPAGCVFAPSQAVNGALGPYRSRVNAVSYAGNPVAVATPVGPADTFDVEHAVCSDTCEGQVVTFAVVTLDQPVIVGTETYDQLNFSASNEKVIAAVLASLRRP